MSRPRKMFWEWNRPHRLIGDDGVTVFSCDLIVLRESHWRHTPRIDVGLVIWNWALLDFSYYNAANPGGLG